MGDIAEISKNILSILLVGTAPLYELVLLMYVQPPPLNYVAASIPPACLAAYLLKREKESEKLLLQQIKSTFVYDVEKSVEKYVEYLKNYKENNKKK